MNQIESTQPKEAHGVTVEHQRKVQSELNFEDRRDFDRASRGFIGTVPHAHIEGPDGNTVWDLERYAFVKGDEAPATVNPSLWRIARLNMNHGLFKVTERIYQVRGFDIANITFIEGDTGLIIVDTLTHEEAARAALALYTSHRGERPIHTIIYTHSHRDHYGGTKGLIDASRAGAGVEILAPAGFLQESMSEAVLLGPAATRRALFQFGTTLPAGAKSQVDSGLGKPLGRGTWSMVAPTREITQAESREVIDGVEVVFHLTPGAEAPADMNIFFPQLRALNLAENACQTMHNLCPMRGAKIRDSHAWSTYLNEALDRYVPDADVVFAQHHWPTWGQDEVREFVAGQRDMYRWLHDQTLRLICKGLTPREIAEELMMPNRLSRQWWARGYYGAVSHNVKAIYAFYMGPYDGNPATLDALPPQAEGRKYVEYMGGADAVVAKARGDYERGEFRWVVQVLNNVVFAQPEHRGARELAADAMEQLAYQSEAATWRNSYLLGALELRQGMAQPKNTRGRTDMWTAVTAELPMEHFFNYLAIRVNGQLAQQFDARFDWVLVDSGASYRLTLSNGALSYRPGSHGSGADAVIRTDRVGLASMLSAGSLEQAFKAGQLPVTGNLELIGRFLSVLETFDGGFNVIEP